MHIIHLSGKAGPLGVVVERITHLEVILELNRANEVVVNEDGSVNSTGTRVFLETGASPVVEDALPDIEAKIIAALMPGGPFVEGRS